MKKQTNKEKPFACLVLVRLIFVCFESKLRLIIHKNIENINYPRIARLYIYFFLRSYPHETPKESNEYK